MEQDIAVYVHADGHEEEVSIVKHHVECDSFTIFVPSLKRERQTTAARLRLGRKSTSELKSGNAHPETVLPPVTPITSENRATAESTPISGAASDWPSVARSFSHIDVS